MTTDLDAIYENGAFRPLDDADLPLADGALVHLTVESVTTKEPASAEPQQGNGLAALGGGWTQQQLESFEASIAVTGQVDEELWR